MAKKSFTANMNAAAENFISNAPQKETKSETITLTPAEPIYAPIRNSLFESKSRRVQLLMQPTLHAALKDKAEQNGQSFNDYVHSILEEHIKGE